MTEDEATEHLALWRNDVGRFALDCFGFSPDRWQRKVFDHWDAGRNRIAMKACKGPGKTAVLAILIWHFLATRPRPKVACTSISGANLSDGLWTELAKWQQKSPFLMRAFEWTKTRVECRDHREEWWCSARTWSRTANAEDQAKTLAGLHAEYILFVLDETGGMPEAVMVAAEAALASGTECRILQAGNPIECSGPLWTACNRDRELWAIVEITGDPDDPDRSPRIDMTYARQQIESHGRDNPWVMANILGKFPSASPLTFIGLELVENARKREARCEITDPLVIGVDVARFGDDKTVFRTRKGRDARTHPPIKLRNMDNVQVATRLVQYARSVQADGVFIDGGGMGAGVVDICRAMHLPNVYEIQFGAKPDNIVIGTETAAWADKAAEMWGNTREWLKGGAIDEDPDLYTDLTTRRYAYKIRSGRTVLMLEPKDAMKTRGLASPDDGDGLALTFALPVQAHARAGFAGAEALRPMAQALTEYDPFNPGRVVVPGQAGAVATEYDPFGAGG